MLSCRDLVQDAALLPTDDAPWRRLLSIRMHLLMCRDCRRYVSQLGLLVRAIPFMHDRASDEEVAKILALVYSKETERQ